MKLASMFSVIALVLTHIAVALTDTEMSAIEHFLESTALVGTGNGPTNEEITHDLASALGLHNSARLLYKYSPDAHAAYNTMYDSLLFLSVSGFTTPAQKKQVKKVISYFESSLL
ncbi:hypothetical protein BX070DRAFT_218887, partial [Coemansia spiralis]